MFYVNIIQTQIVDCTGNGNDVGMPWCCPVSPSGPQVAMENSS